MNTSFVNTLRAWEQHLLSLLASELCDLPIIIATDGSLQQQQVSFGWIISTPDGHPIAQGSRIAFSATLSLFWCEAHGILAPLHFLV